MCGIAGFIDLAGRRQGGDIMVAAAERMADAIRHRGPDDGGVWIDEERGIGLSHRRLSIIDLSVRGRQPMASGSGRFVAVYNGEVYNFRDIARELERDSRITWRSGTDTEVILEAVERWGVDAAVKRFNGMFAFALWDTSRCVLTLVRDRIGKKPLYYGINEGTLLFGSELKALRAFPGFNGIVDHDALAMLLRHNYVPSPASIYQGVRKLPPGSIVEIGLDWPGRFPSTASLPSPRTYWNPKEVIAHGSASPFQGTVEDAISRLEDLVDESVGRRMLSDVPLGAFLSGGIDSSVVVAAMQRQSNRPVKTFSIGYSARDADEARHARRVAAYLGTDHTDIYVEPGEVLDTVAEVGAICDEPTGDTAMIPTYILAKETRRHVTVALSGDGGDETFAGYRRYLYAADTWRRASSRFGCMPSRIRRSVSRALGVLLERPWNGMARSASGLNDRGGANGGILSRLREIERLLRITSPEWIHADIAHWKEPSRALRCGRPFPCVLNDPAQWLFVDDPVQRLVHLDLASRLPDSILAKVDRATMRSGLEARAPLLDYGLVEFAMSIPTAMKIGSGTGKHLLRELLYRHVPRELVDRPKMGFSMPIADWLRGPLRDWADDLIAEGRLKREGYFKVSAVRGAWREHLDGRRNRHYELWDVLMFQSWLSAGA